MSSWPRRQVEKWELRSCTGEQRVDIEIYENDVRKQGILMMTFLEKVLRQGSLFFTNHYCISKPRSQVHDTKWDLVKETRQHIHLTA